MVWMRKRPKKKSNTKNHNHASSAAIQTDVTMDDIKNLNNQSNELHTLKTQFEELRLNFIKETDEKVELENMIKNMSFVSSKISKADMSKYISKDIFDEVNSQLKSVQYKNTSLSLIHI